MAADETRVPAGESSPPEVPALPSDGVTLEAPAAPAAWRVSVPNYRILRRLGEGGMGEVFEAEQQRPIRRRVALKVVRWGMDSREAVARFAAERQVLALMDHPNIARIYDAGETEQGRPYFAMEHVRGVPISEYCDTHHLGIRERLELFAQVCAGVQHAHQKGIIHRDLKPSNVLIEMHEDRPRPKIIDFGVAKATDRRLEEGSVATEFGQLIGTPEYMSPEQAEMSGLDVDTRSDVYSLGVLLYELLVGELPFASSALRGRSLSEVQRTIREQEPPRPSVRLSASERRAELAKARGSEPGALVREVGGDLDWIVTRALEKDRTRRYPSASELAADIERYLGDQPVVARPPSALYRARKFAVRHRAGMVSATLVLVALLIGLAAATAGLMRARRAEAAAHREAETASRVSDFLVDLFQVSDPGEALGDTITARTILDQGAQRLARELYSEPATRARLMDTIGTVYGNLGLYQEASTLLEQSLASRDAAGAPDDLALADTLTRLARVRLQQGDYRQAQAMAERALAIQEASLGPEAPAVAESLATLAWALARQSRPAEAKPLFERALALREKLLPADDPGLAASRSDLGVFHWQQGDYAAAEPLLNKALESYEATLGPNDFRIRKTLNDLAVLYWSENRLDQAEALFQRSLAIKERVLGPDHPEVGTTLNNLALIDDARGDYTAAEPLLRRAVAVFDKSLGRQHDRTAMALANLAWILYRQGRYGEAEPLYQEALGIYEARLGPEHGSVAILLGDEAKMYRAEGRFDEAQRLLLRAASIWEGRYGPMDTRLAECLHTLAGIYAEQGRPAEAEPLFRRALAIRTAKLAADDPALAETRRELADLLRRSGRGAEAEGL